MITGAHIIICSKEAEADRAFFHEILNFPHVDVGHGWLIPYRSAAAVLTDLLSGQVQLYFGTTASSLEYVRTGKLRALAVTIERRLDALPDIPTVGEFLPGYEASNWYGLGAPKNTPAEIVAKLNKEINAALADPKMKARLAD